MVLYVKVACFLCSGPMESLRVFLVHVGSHHIEDDAEVSSSKGLRQIHQFKASLLHLFRGVL